MKHVVLLGGLVLFGSMVPAVADRPIPGDSKQRWDFRGKPDYNVEAYRQLFECQTYEELRDGLIVAIPVLEEIAFTAKASQLAADCRVALVRAHYLLGEVDKGDAALRRFADARRLDRPRAPERARTPEEQLAQAGELEREKDRKCLAIYAELLSADDFAVRWRALERLRKLTHLDFEYFASAEEEDREGPAGEWREWVKEDGAAAVIRWGAK